jgi:hypothetical protein
LIENRCSKGWGQGTDKIPPSPCSPFCASVDGRAPRFRAADGGSCSPESAKPPQLLTLAARRASARSRLPLACRAHRTPLLVSQHLRAGACLRRAAEGRAPRRPRRSAPLPTRARGERKMETGLGRGDCLCCCRAAADPSVARGLLRRALNPHQPLNRTRR